MYITIVKPYVDGPAYKAGMLPGDIIYMVDGVDVSGMVDMFNNPDSGFAAAFANADLSGYSTNVTFSGTSISLIFYAGSASAFKAHYTQYASFAEISYDDYLKNPSAEYKNTIVYGTENCECGKVMTNETTFMFTDYLSQMSDAIT